MSNRCNIFLLSGLKNILKKILFVSVCILINSCFENPTPPVVATSQISTISTNEYIVGGEVKSDGGSEIFEKGLCLSSLRNPTVSDARYIAGYGNEDFEIALSLPSGNYFIRAYAVNGAGIGYGNVLTITYVFIQVVIVDFAVIDGNSAFMRARIEPTETTISARGACWDTQPNPTVENNKNVAGDGDGIFETTLTGLTPGTTYYARAYAVTDTEIFYSENYEFTTIDYPHVTTKEIINAGTFVISTGGDIQSVGIILNAGVCWSTNPSPTISDNKTEDQLFYSEFYSDPYGLLPEQTYYIRAYATNIAGTGYGNELVVTMPTASVYDIDGNPYSSVSIGSQTWITENLRTSKYSNGDVIPNISDLSQWQQTTAGAWSHYENISQFEVPYGKLYNWFAITDSRNACPSGWHVPSESEWDVLINFLGGKDIAGNHLKETGTAHWNPNNDFATNSTGFTALPGGARSTSIGISYPLNSLGLFWSVTSSIDDANAIGYYLFDSYQSIIKQEYIKQTGLSIRCLKD